MPRHEIVGVSLGAFLTGNGVLTSVRAGMSLAQIGEFSFILAGLGIGTALYFGLVLIGFGGLLSFGHSAYFGIGAYLVALSGAARVETAEAQLKNAQALHDTGHPVVLAGAGTAGLEIVDVLLDLGALPRDAANDPAQHGEPEVRILAVTLWCPGERRAAAC